MCASSGVLSRCSTLTARCVHHVLPLPSGAWLFEACLHVFKYTFVLVSRSFPTGVSAGRFPNVCFAWGEARTLPSADIKAPHIIADSPSHVCIPSRNCLTCILVIFYYRVSPHYPVVLVYAPSRQVVLWQIRRCSLFGEMHAISWSWSADHGSLSKSANG